MKIANGKVFLHLPTIFQHLFANAISIFFFFCLLKVFMPFFHVNHPSIFAITGWMNVEMENIAVGLHLYIKKFTLQLSIREK